MTDGLIDFLTTTARLKSLKRAGWQRCGVANCESVAEHTFGVALLALLTPGEGIDRNRSLQLALVHDLAESIVGDLTPHDSVAPHDKQTRERHAMRQLSRMVGDERLIE